MATPHDHEQIPSDVRRVIVTGQIGCGKTTFAVELATSLGVTHVRLDQFNGSSDPHALAAAQIDATGDEWIVDGCVWQVPSSVWALAELVVHLDYRNLVHYRRILKRTVQRCLRARAVSDARTAIAEEYEHFQITRRFADENRTSWAAAGGICAHPVPVITCNNPAEAATLLHP